MRSQAIFCVVGWRRARPSPQTMQRNPRNPSTTVSTKLVRTTNFQRRVVEETPVITSSHRRSTSRLLQARHRSIVGDHQGLGTVVASLVTTLACNPGVWMGPAMRRSCALQGRSRCSRCPDSVRGPFHSSGEPLRGGRNGGGPWPGRSWCSSRRSCRGTPRG